MTVRLVGAGCGSPLWITLEGKRILERADAVVYDALIHPDLLQLAPPRCSFHFAGKRKGRASMDQEGINRLLVELGTSGKEVVRLKGGDPFVFGRGGEEVLALERAGIPWTFTPGITAATGGLGRAGIPPTHRGAAESVTLVTGHSGGGTSPDTRLWRTLANLDGTIAIYMGASSWKTLSRLLLEGGMPAGTPCSVVTWGGWGRSSRRDLFLGGPEPEMPSPSILVAGGTAALSLSPVRGPLSGMQVGVVRPFPESWSTARELEELGADGFSVPLLALEEIRNPGEAEILAAADWIILTSPRGASLLLRSTDPRTIRGRVAAIGEGTAQALASLGIRADAVASPPTSEGLAYLISERVEEGSRVVLFRNEAGSPLPGKAALSRKAVVTDLPAYRMMRCLPPGWESFEAQWKENGLHALVFGSGALAESWGALAPDPPVGTALVAWGEPCGKSVEKVFRRKPVVMAEPSSAGLVETLTRLWQERKEEK